MVGSIAILGALMVGVSVVVLSVLWWGSGRLLELRPLQLGQADLPGGLFALARVRRRKEGWPWPAAR